jgi:hypothetical protein
MDPVKNTVCGHVYEKESIMNLISIKRSTKCPGKIKIEVCIIISLVWCPGQNHRIVPISFFRGCKSSVKAD